MHRHALHAQAARHASPYPHRHGVTCYSACRQAWMQLQGPMQPCPRSALPVVRPLVARVAAWPGHSAAWQRQPRGGVWISVQPSRLAAQTATTACQAILGSRPRRHVRAWRPSRAQICTPAVRSTRTTRWVLPTHSQRQVLLEHAQGRPEQLVRAAAVRRSAAHPNRPHACRRNA
jgi:hypothetical protein